MSNQNTQEQWKLQNLMVRFWEYKNMKNSIGLEVPELPKFSRQVLEFVKERPHTEKEILNLKLSLSLKRPDSQANLPSVLHDLANKRLLFENTLTRQFSITSLGRMAIDDNSIEDMFQTGRREFKKKEILISS